MGEREKEEGTEGEEEDSQPLGLRMSRSNLSPHILSTVLTEEEFVSLLTTPKRYLRRNVIWEKREEGLQSLTSTAKEK